MAKPVSLLIIVFLLLYIAPLGVRPLMAPDETRYGEISREMIASGDWVVPRLNGLRYFEKPILGYWLNAVAMCLFGENEFAVRLPSALAAGLTALLLGLWARRFAGDKAAGLLAAAVFLLSFEVFVVGVFCVLDSLFSLFVTATILFFCFAHEFRNRNRWPIVVSGVCCGLAFLTKGPLGLVIPAIVLAPFMLWEGRFKAALKVIWLPCIAAVLVALPWCVMIHRREPDFWHYFLWVEHIGRFIQPNRGQHARPLWYYVPIIVGGAMPWTPLVGTIVQGLRRTGFKNQMVRLALCWLILPFLFFSASGGKLGTYILVCFPALAFLIAVGLLQCLGQGDTKGFVTGAWFPAAGAGILLCTLVLSFFVPLSGLPFLTRSWPWLLTAVGLLAWCVLSLAAIARIRAGVNDYSPLLLYWLAPVLFMFSWHFVTAAVASPDKVPGAFLLSNSDCGANKDCTIVSDCRLAAAACWYYKRADIFILGGLGEYEYGLDYADSKHRLIEAAQLKNLLVVTPSGVSPNALTGTLQTGKKCVAMVTSTDRYNEAKSEFPQPIVTNTTNDLIFAQFSPSVVVEK